MDFIPYNSRLTYHKSPFGAVREGERVTMRIVLPRSLGCTGASLIIDSDGGSSRVYPMTWERMERTDEEWWPSARVFIGIASLSQGVTAAS